MFGGTVFTKKVVGVTRMGPGRQELKVTKIGGGAGQENTTGNGSHQTFWDIFYRSVNPLRPLLRPSWAAALAPVSGDPFWQARRRNEINYDPFRSLSLASDFQKTFRKDTFPACLTGAMATQYGLLDALVELVFSYADQFQLHTDSLGVLHPAVARRDLVQRLVYGERAPGLVRKTKKTAVA
jgi:hypothetical protein